VNDSSIVRKTKFPALTRTNRFNKLEGMHQSIETWNIIENKIFHFFFTNQDFSLMYYFESTQGFSVVWDYESIHASLLFPGIDSCSQNMKILIQVLTLHNLYSSGNNSTTFTPTSSLLISIVNHKKWRWLENTRRENVN
jgi:hypothetical protein